MIPIPFNDQYRQNELNASQNLDTAQDPCLDHLTNMACRQFGVPIALVSLVDENRQWFKSAQGLDKTETPKHMAFCAHAIMSDALLIVLDAAEDKRFIQNPLVTDGPKVRFYAGAPLISSGGFRWGTFCIIDPAPHDAFSNEDAETLKDFAAIASRLLEQNGPADTTTPNSTVENAFTDLFSYLAHEIRSPLANIGAVSRAFSTEAFGQLGNDQYKEFASLMAENSVQIMEILDRMLDFGHMQQGEVNLREEQNDLSTIFSKVVRQITQTHPNSVIETKLIEEHSNSYLVADSTLLTQMLVNLVDNSCKYGADSSSISLKANLLEGGGLALIVEDRGYGLSAEEAGRAMQPYRRIVRQIKNSPKGIGIGLPLVKRLVELHGGSLSLMPRKGGGTRVFLNFPEYRVVQPVANKTI